MRLSPECPAVFGCAAFALILGAVAALAQGAPDYVGSEACVDCHRETSDAWTGSHHDLAWTEPSSETVVADFDGTAFKLGNMEARFRIEGEAYHVSVTETDGVTTDYRVHSVAGIEPLQQYLLETEPGRLQSFDVVWDTERGEWFHLYPDQDLPPDDGLHWTGPYKTWNARCAECHATGFDKTYDAATRSYASTQAEIGVGCEACHGPGAAHLAWAEESDAGRPPAKAPETRRYETDLDRFGFTQSFATTEATIQQCATCHSRREAHDDASPLPGTPYHDAYGLALLRPGLYQADGQILDEVYVYGSFLQSKMYARGVGCLDCHDAHTAKLVAQGNAVCTQCHSPAGNPEFDTLQAGEYDAPSHHFHEPGTEGAQCKNCHAPERVYMGNDWRADHSFRVPRPDLANETGAPDACTTCHTDRDPSWAAEEIDRRFPERAQRGPHYGVTLARGRQNPVESASDLAELAKDETQPAIVRATALWLLESANSPGTAARVAPLLSDADPLVRTAAVGTQRTAAPEDRVLNLLDALSDPVRSVRMATAKALLGAPIARLPAATQNSLSNAMTEWRSALASRLDFPETHLQLAGMALTMRAFPQAVAAFEEAVSLDPQLVDAWLMLIRISATTEGKAAASAVLDEAIRSNPDNLDLLELRRQLDGRPIDGSDLVPPAQ